jgi:hypothetical protein
VAAKKIKFARKAAKSKKPKGGNTDFNFGANARGGKRRRGGFGGGS